MLPYTRQYFEELLTTGRIRCIRPSDTVYESRKDFGESQLGTPLAAKKLGGFRLLQGSGQFSGEILGGCIDSIFDMFNPSRYADMPEICRKYGLFPDVYKRQIVDNTFRIVLYSALGLLTFDTLKTCLLYTSRCV